MIRHQFYDVLRLVGLRDRLRCPRCKAVGTYKPHGGWLDREDARKVRRWMCKWCGLYRGPEGEFEAVSDPNVGAWQLTDAAGPGSMTPKQAVETSSIGKTWPWRG